MSLLSAPGGVHIKTTLMKSLAEALWYTQTQTVCSCQNKYWRQLLPDGEMLRPSNISEPGVYTSKVIQYYKQHSRGQRGLMHGQYCSWKAITPVDLIQRKKLDFRNFYDSNLTEARFNYLSCIRIMMVCNGALSYVTKHYHM